MAGPLKDILVVALEQAVAAPFATSRLADAGARVIKIERAEGDFARDYDHVVNGESAYFVWLNRGKESLVLNLKDSDDAALLMRIMGEADVFIQNLAPGASARVGFGSEDLRVRFPALITCDISGYGEDGPFADMKAYDLLIQCEAGLASITGTADAPGRVGVSAADISCGMNAHSAILQALFVRRETGKGSGIKVSLFDAIADWMAVPLLHQDYGGNAPKRVGLAHPSIAPYGAFPVGDGHQAVIAVQNPREWQALCQFLDCPEWIDDLRFANNVERCTNRVALDTMIAEKLSRFTGEKLAIGLKKAGIAFGFVNSVDGLSSHPQLRRATVETPNGPANIPAPPVRWSDEVLSLAPVPALNQNGSAIREEFSGSC